MCSPSMRLNSRARVLVDILWASWLLVIGNRVVSHLHHVHRDTDDIGDTGDIGAIGDTGDIGAIGAIGDIGDTSVVDAGSWWH